MAEGRRSEVEAGHDVVRPHVLEAAQDDAPETEDGIDQLAAAGRQGGVEEGEVGAVDEPVGIEQHEPFHWSSLPPGAARPPRSGPGGQRRSGSSVARRATARTIRTAPARATRPAPMSSAGSGAGGAGASSIFVAWVAVSMTDLPSSAPGARGASVGAAKGARLKSGPPSAPPVPASSPPSPA